MSRLAAGATSVVATCVVALYSCASGLRRSPDDGLSVKDEQECMADAASCPIVEIWGVPIYGVNGRYELVRSEGDVNGSTDRSDVYKSKNDDDHFLYYSQNGRWWVGEHKDMASRSDHGWMASDNVAKGKHPMAAGVWQYRSMQDGEGKLMKKDSFGILYLPAAADHYWKEARATAKKMPVLEVRGALGPQVNGRYDFVEQDADTSPPLYRHQVKTNKWIYLARSGQWWIGRMSDMETRKARGFLHSEAVTPGTLPSAAIWTSGYIGSVDDAAESFENYSGSVLVAALEDEPTAAMAWQKALEEEEAGTILEVWGVPEVRVNGRYELQLSGGTKSEPPVFQHSAIKDKWLYVAEDGAWWFGQTGAKEKRAAHGWMHSAAIKAPGEMPWAAVEWEAHVQEESEFRPVTELLEDVVYHEPRFFWKHQEAAAEWKKLALQRATAVQVEGASLTFLNGFYDLSEAASSDDSKPPVFQHRAGSDNYLFVAVDGTWWVGKKASMQTLQPRGFMHSAPIEPGQGPTQATGWHVYDGSWQKQTSVCIK